MTVTSLCLLHYSRASYWVHDWANMSRLSQCQCRVRLGVRWNTQADLKYFCTKRRVSESQEFPLPTPLSILIECTYALHKKKEQTLHWGWDWVTLQFQWVLMWREGGLDWYWWCVNIWSQCWCSYWYWPEQPVLPVVVRHVVAVSVSPRPPSPPTARGRARLWLEAGWLLFPLCPLLDGLVIDGEQEVGPGQGGEGALRLQRGQQRLPSSSCCLLHQAPRTVQALPNFWQLTRRLQELVGFLLQLWAQLSHGFLEYKFSQVFFPFSLFAHFLMVNGSLLSVHLVH